MTQKHYILTEAQFDAMCLAMLDMSGDIALHNIQLSALASEGFKVVAQLAAHVTTNAVDLLSLDMLKRNDEDQGD